MTKVFSKCINLFLCMSIKMGISLTALCRALCLLWCGKLENPSKAKPINPEIITPKIPLLFLCSV